MGTIRYTTDVDGHAEGLYDHEGWIVPLAADGTRLEDDQLTVAFRAGCECGWRGATVRDRARGESAWLDWEDLPELEAEWLAHTDPLLDALAGTAQRANLDAVRWTLDLIATQARQIQRGDTGDDRDRLGEIVEAAGAARDRVDLIHRALAHRSGGGR